MVERPENRFKILVKAIQEAESRCIKRANLRKRTAEDIGIIGPETLVRIGEDLVAARKLNKISTDLLDGTMDCLN